MPGRILIVDDDPGTCGLFQEVLSSTDRKSFALTDSREAAAYLAIEKFDAVFVDVNMPSPDGIELTRNIRSTGLNRTTPIMIITGEDDVALLSRAFEAGATYFLFKPVDRNRILSLIRVTQDSIEQEKRRFRRVKVRCKVIIESGQERFDGWTLDLSPGGMFVQSSRVLPISSSIRINLELKEGSQTLSMAAMVLRVVGKDCMGLQFENLGPQNTMKIQAFLLPVILECSN